MAGMDYTEEEKTLDKEDRERLHSLRKRWRDDNTMTHRQATRVANEITMILNMAYCRYHILSKA